MEKKYKAYGQWGQDKELPEDDSFAQSFDDLAKDRFLLGDVDEVSLQIEEQRRVLGINHFIFRIWWPGMDARHAYRVVELLGQEVVPRFK